MFTKSKKLSLFDLAYDEVDAKTGRPFATYEKVLEYIKLGADPNEVRQGGSRGYQRPIFIAAMTNNLDAARGILMNGGNQDLGIALDYAKNPDMVGEISYRKEKSHPSLFDLIYSKADVEAGRQFTQLGRYVVSPKQIERLIKKGADVNEERKGDSHNTYQKPIFLANAIGDYESFMCLIKHGAIIDVKRGELEFLLRNSTNPEIEKVLLEYKKRKDIEYKKGKDMKEKSESASCELRDLDYKNATAADVQKLIRKGADVNVILRQKLTYTEKGDEYTPIFAAIQANNWEVFKTLVDNGANLTAYWEDYFPYNEPVFGKIASWIDTHGDFLHTICMERESHFRNVSEGGRYWGEMLPMVQIGNDKQCYRVKGGVVSLTAFEGGKNLVKTLRHRKEVDSDRQEVVGLLDTLNKAKATTSRKIAKEAIVKEYRKKHPKSSSR